MRTIIGPSGGDCVLIILFQLYVMALTLNFLKIIYSGWVTMTTPRTFILEEELVQY